MKKKRIGVIIDTVHGIYQERIIQSLIEQTRNEDVELFFICGLGILDIAGEYEVHEGVLELANVSFFDGLICVVGSFSNFLSKEWVNHLIEHYKDKVKISFAFNSENIKSIMIDNVGSMEKIMTHLIRDLKCKTIGYISGPLVNEEAELRYEAYKLMLNDYSIEISKQFFYEGYFMESSGKNAIKDMFKKGSKIPDAIVCANDEMAIGASYELLKNGIAIPYGVKVTGFDNLKASAAFEVPITTIDQPIDGMVSSALKYLDEKFYGKDETDILPISGDLVIRESTNWIKEEEVMKIAVLRESSFIDDNIIGEIIRFEEELDDHLARLSHAFFVDLDVSDKEYVIFEKMLKGLISDTKSATSQGLFLKHTKELSNILVDKIPYSLFNHRFNEFKHLISDLVFSNQLFYRIQEIMFETALAVNNSFYSIESALNHKVKVLYGMSRSFVNLVDQSTNLEEYIEQLQLNVTRYQLQEFYLFLYEKPVCKENENKLQLPLKTKMVIGVNNKHIYQPEEFLTAEVYPEIIAKDHERKNLVILEIIRNQTHYGYLSMNLDVEVTQYYETIRLSISQGLHRLMSK